MRVQLDNEIIVKIISKRVRSRLNKDLSLPQTQNLVSKAFGYENFSELSSCIAKPKQGTITYKDFVTWLEDHAHEFEENNGHILVAEDFILNQNQNSAFLKKLIGINDYGHSLSLRPNQRVLLLGGSGSGKSMLMQQMILESLHNFKHILLIDRGYGYARLNQFLGAKVIHAKSYKEFFDALKSIKKRKITLIESNYLDFSLNDVGAELGLKFNDFLLKNDRESIGIFSEEFLFPTLFSKNKHIGGCVATQLSTADEYVANQKFVTGQSPTPQIYHR